MKAARKTLVILLCLAGAAPAITSCGRDQGGTDGAPAARPAASAPLEIALKPKHRSAVTGTAMRAPAGANLTVP